MAPHRRLLLVVGLLALGLGSAPAAGDKPIRMGWTAWSDGVFVTRLAQRLIENRLDHRVQLDRNNIASQYQGIASDRLDAMLMSWQPRTHAPYVRRVAGHVSDLGVIYDSARLGWAVPDYVPKEAVATIGDLAKPQVQQRLEGRIAGIGPGAGLMRLSHQALEDYDLDDYHLKKGSGPRMTQRLEQAVEHKKWIVVTAWNPHWMFAAHHLRYLDDPEGVFGGAEQIHVLTRRGFYRDHPRIGRLLTRMWLPRHELEDALLRAHRQSTTKAVDHYIDTHPERIRRWLGTSS